MIFSKSNNARSQWMTSIEQLLFSSIKHGPTNEVLWTWVETIVLTAGSKLGKSREPRFSHATVSDHRTTILTQCFSTVQLVLGLFGGSWLKTCWMGSRFTAGSSSRTRQCSHMSNSLSIFTPSARPIQNLLVSGCLLRLFGVLVLGSYLHHQHKALPLVERP